ncbi:8-oxo-dGTP diphosphatase [Anaerocolumna aminovalerica]|uniref:8-oxo-dGTP diphosphatase n=1 Tax=Anaerocolumna aminovalerica TaxID=1527 RepID=UPI001C0F06C8|nr:8-oxo-dGTP diphosphatase [Anaerocolumna aminovalerica]MBU5333637.1 8-oxo-dGTP diphosphatase [Anaerocolumna aminovalerica]
MSRNEKAIFTNMCMIYKEDSILVQDRRNPDWPGVTFPGGHVEYGESFVESVKREVFEETGLTIENPVLCGIKQFQTKEDERYVVLFFKTNQFKGDLRSSKEGDVFWIKKEELKQYPVANDFLDMVSVFESDELSEFYYYKELDDWKKKLL